MSLILAGALCLTLCTGALAVSGFSDVPDGKWYTAEIREMTAAGYIDGYEDGTFRPGRGCERGGVRDHRGALPGP